MPSLFHQNMRTFGGGSVIRNVAYANAFAAMAGGIAAPVVAAGFTEISNPNAPLRGRLAAFSATLNPALTSLVIAQVGTSALGLVEYVGMTWNPLLFAVTHGGMVVFNNLTRVWTTYITPAPFPAVPILTIPAGNFHAVDSRGPAFLAGTYNGAATLVMFMHNMYNTGDRSNGYSSLQNSARSVIDGLPAAFAMARVYIGGDFNVAPRPLNKRRGNLPVLASLAARAGGLPAGALINTTVANCYDFWLLRTPAAVPVASAAVRLQSRVAHASDHAGITLVL